MTTTPSIETLLTTSRMASTAAWSAASLSPRPIHRPAASEAASVTRASSRARLRSGAWPCSIGSSGSAAPALYPASIAGCVVQLSYPYLRLGAPSRDVAGSVVGVTTARDRWQQAFEKSERRDADFTTMSGIPVAPVYGPEG